MSGGDGLQNNDVCLDQASDEDSEIVKGSDYVEESSRQNECEKKEEKRQAQTPVKKTVWVLVFFLEENKHSPPILLKKVQDKSGCTGVEADLQKHDFCMAQYEVGGEMRKAFIVSRSENSNKEELEKKYEKMVEWMKQAQEESNGNLWHYTKVIGVGLLAGGFTVVAAPFALSAAGFTTGGIAAGSIASQLMSWAAIAQGGGVAAASAGGWIAALQSAGAAGIGFFSNLVLGVGAGTAGSVLTHTFSENPGSSEETENQCKICLDDKMDTVFDPCGHLFTCSSCAKKLPKCPICRKPIEMLHIANKS